MKYVPEQFVSIAESELGRQLWAFLIQPDSMLKMRMAAKFSRPAVQGVEDDLLELFGDQVREDRVKQAIGHMTKQVMEHQGYIPEQANVQCIGSPLFSRATRYTKKIES